MSNMYMPRGYMPPANIPQETPQGLALQKALGSGLFLAAAICYSLTVLVSVYGWFTPMAALAGTLSALFTQLPDIPGFHSSQGEI